MNHHSDKIDPDPLKYTGRLSALYKIWIVNLILTILTLGFYRFWARNRQRRYVISSFAISDDHLEYSGKGGELFKGFIKALIFLFIIAIPLIIASTHVQPYYEELALDQAEAQKTKQQQKAESFKDFLNENPNLKQWIEGWDEDETGEETETTIDNTVSSVAPTPRPQVTPTPTQKLAQYVLLLSSPFYLLFLPYLAFYGAFGYITRRIRWRGIRGHLTGSALKYALMGTLHWVHIILTLGITKPLADHHLIRYKLSNLYFGSQKADFHGKAGKLMLGHFLTSYLLPFIILVTIAIILVCLAIFSDAFLESMINPVFIGTTLIILLLPILLLCRFWYKAALIRYKFNHLTIGHIGFQNRTTTWKLFKLRVINMLITLMTLNLGAPIVIQRNMRFLAKHTTIIGNVNELEVSQSTAKLEGSGEGLAEALDLDMGIF